MPKASLVRRTVKGKAGETKRFYVKITGDDGGVRRHSLDTTDQGEAETRLAEIQDNLKHKRPWDYRPRVAIDQFTDELPGALRMHDRREVTIANTMYAWRTFVDYAKPAELADVTEHDVIAFRQHLKRKGLSNRTIALMMNQCSGVFTLAKVDLRQFDGANPFRGVARPKWKAEQPRFLSEAQVTEVIEMARVHGANMHLFFALGLFAGLRHREITYARWNWCTWDRQGALTVQKGPCFDTKSGKPRRIPMSNELRPILEAHRAEDGYIIYPAKPPVSHRRWRVVCKASFQSVCKAAGVPDLKVHELRHTFASRLAQAGRSETKIARWLGHSDTRVTQIYMQLSEADDDDINVDLE